VRGAAGTANAATAPGQVPVAHQARAPATCPLPIPGRKRPQNSRRRLSGPGVSQRRRPAHPHWRLRVRTAPLFGSKMSGLRRAPHPRTLHAAPAGNHFVADKLQCRHRDQCNWYSRTIAPRLTRTALRPFPQLAQNCLVEAAALPLVLYRNEPPIRHLVYLECGICARSSGDDHQSKHDSDHPLRHVPPPLRVGPTQSPIGRLIHDNGSVMSGALPGLTPAPQSGGKATDQLGRPIASIHIQRCS